MKKFFLLLIALAALTLAWPASAPAQGKAKNSPLSELAPLKMAAPAAQYKNLTYVEASQSGDAKYYTRPLSIGKVNFTKALYGFGQGGLFIVRADFNKPGDYDKLLAFFTAKYGAPIPDKEPGVWKTIRAYLDDESLVPDDPSRRVWAAGDAQETYVILRQAPSSEAGGLVFISAKLAENKLTRPTAGEKPGRTGQDLMAGLPNYDVESYCRDLSASSTSAAINQQDCLNREAAAKRRLTASAPPQKAVSTCDAVISATSGSYTALEKCLEEKPAD